MRSHLDSSFDIWVVRTGAHILEIFGSVALLLAVIGLYALNAYTVGAADAGNRHPNGAWRGYRIDADA